MFGLSGIEHLGLDEPLQQVGAEALGCDIYIYIYGQPPQGLPFLSSS